MNLKETIISSFFFHLILFLLVATLSNYTSGFPGSFDNVISVNLTMDDDKNLSETGHDTSGKTRPASSQPPDEAASQSAQSVKNPSKELREIPKPEDKAAADTGPVQTENAEKLPTQGEGSDKLEAYYQFIMLHRKVFGQKAGLKVNELIGEAFKVNTRSFYGGTATVSLKFGPEGELIGVTVDSGSSDLTAFLEEVRWYDMPAPAAYLGRTVQIDFTVLEGYLGFEINTF